MTPTGREHEETPALPRSSDDNSPASVITPIRPYTGEFAGSDDATTLLLPITDIAKSEYPRRDSNARRAAGTAPALLPVGGRPPLRLYISQLLRRWPFALAQAKAQALTANRGLVLGNLWLILSPLLEALAYLLIFGIILTAGRGIDNYVGFLLIGVFLFQYTTRAVNDSTGIILSNKGLIRAFAFPRAALPLALTMRNALNTLPAILVLLLLIIIGPEPAYPTGYWLLFPIVLALQTVFNFGLSLITARITDILPDLKFVLSFVTRLWMFTSCVMFSPDRIRNLPGGSLYLDVNPMFQVLDISRDLLLYSTLPGPQAWLTLMAWALGILVVGFLFFWRGEVNYGRA